MSASIDPRIRNLSYSSLLTLHRCPREFQIYRLSNKKASAEDDKIEESAEIVIDLEDSIDVSNPPITQEQSVTFAYGHVVGQGVQEVFMNLPLERILFNAFLMWDADLLADDTKRNKSFFKALIAIQQLHSMRSHGFFKDWEVVEYQGKPASELSFLIELPDGFKYRGFVDLVLKHRVTGEVLVLEAKTNSSKNLNPAQYKNSAQAIGYSIVLDAIFPELSSYKVLYLTYLTAKEEYLAIPFDKSYYQRALWINELLLDVELIKLYESASIYPMHGESCIRFYRECDYYQTCTLATERLAKQLTPGIEAQIAKELESFQIKITVEDLIKAQLAKDPTKQSVHTHTEIDMDEVL
jgi:hypothetical protein